LTPAGNQRQGFETGKRKINSPKRAADRINQVDDQLLTPDDELAFTASLSGGPGGQNVNTLTAI
jgi:protein subunit release factor B